LSRGEKCNAGEQVVNPLDHPAKMRWPSGNDQRSDVLIMREGVDLRIMGGIIVADETMRRALPSGQ